MLPNIFPWILPWWIYFTCLKMTSYLRPYMDAMGRRSEKITAILWTKYFFDAASSCFCRHEILFCATSTFFLMTWNTFSCNINTFLSKPNYSLCNVKRFISTQNYFSCSTKFLFWTSFIILCHGDIFLLSHSNNFFIFSFYITHCRHVDLLHSGPGNKETFNHLLLTCLIYTEAVTK